MSRPARSRSRLCAAVRVLLPLAILGLGGPHGGAQARAGGGWMFSGAEPSAAASSAPGAAPGAAESAAGPSSAGPSSAGPAPDARREQNPPREPPGHIFGYPTRQDPLFDDGTRPAYAHQHLERSRWNRPSYAADMPQYVKPSYAQDPIRKPVYQRPLAMAPLDNKPKYDLKNYMAPSVFKPSYEFPTYMDRPNYVIQPDVKPAINRPAYDHSGIRYAPPVYAPPAYTPEEYKPPRFAPSPFIAPPR